MNGSHDRSHPFERRDEDLRALFQRTAPNISPTDVEALFAAVRSDSSHPKRILSRRLVMTIRMTFASVIAAGAAVAFSFLVPRETSAAFNFAAVQREVAATRTVTFKLTTTLDGKPSSTRTLKYLARAQECLRFEGEGFYTVINLKSRKSMYVNAEMGVVEFEELPPDLPSTDLYSLLVEMARDPVESLPARVMDGKRALGFVAIWHGHEVSIWVDPETKLPVRVEETLKEHGHTMNTVRSDFVFDRPLDDALFKMEPPVRVGNGGFAAKTPIVITSSEPPLPPLPSDRSLAAPGIVPLLGIGPARFGMSKQKVVEQLGKPDHEFVSGRTTYLLYGSRGFELAIEPDDRPTKGLSRVTCFDRQDGPIRPRREFQGQTDKGVRLGAGQAEVIAAYGPPDRIDSAGEKSGQATIHYRKLGLSLVLFRDKVSQIMLERPRPDPGARP